MNVVLISCCSQKNDIVGTPEEVYCSPLFKLSMKYARLLNPDKILILSAKYGVVSLSDTIQPYNQTLTKMCAVDIDWWYAKVMSQLDKSDHYIVLAGKAYYKGLNLDMELPLEGLGIGQRLKRLNELCNSIQHIPGQQTQNIVR